MTNANQVTTRINLDKFYHDHQHLTLEVNLSKTQEKD